MDFYNLELQWGTLIHLPDSVDVNRKSEQFSLMCSSSPEFSCRNWYESLRCSGSKVWLLAILPICLLAGCRLSSR